MERRIQFIFSKKKFTCVSCVLKERVLYDVQTRALTQLRATIARRREISPNDNGQESSKKSAGLDGLFTTQKKKQTREREREDNNVMLGSFLVQQTQLLLRTYTYVCTYVCNVEKETERGGRIGEPKQFSASHKGRGWDCVSGFRRRRTKEGERSSKKKTSAYFSMRSSSSSELFPERHTSIDYIQGPGSNNNNAMPPQKASTEARIGESGRRNGFVGILTGSGPAHTHTHTHLLLESDSTSLFAMATATTATKQQRQRQQQLQEHVCMSSSSSSCLLPRPSRILAFGPSGQYFALGAGRRSKKMECLGSGRGKTQRIKSQPHFFEYTN